MLPHLWREYSHSSLTVNPYRSRPSCHAFQVRTSARNTLLATVSAHCTDRGTVSAQLQVLCTYVHRSFLFLFFVFRVRNTPAHLTVLLIIFFCAGVHVTTHRHHTVFRKPPSIIYLLKIKYTHRFTIYFFLYYYYLPFCSNHIDKYYSLCINILYFTLLF